MVLSYLDSVTNADTSRSFSRKLAPPLVTLLNSEPETQYVALRNINLIVQKRAGILESEIKVRDFVIYWLVLTRLNQKRTGFHFCLKSCVVGVSIRDLYAFVLL